MRASRMFWVLALALSGAIGAAAPAHAAASGPWIQVTAGGAHTCAINTGSSLYCWGSNSFGQVGADTMNTPHRVGAAGVWSTVTAGLNHTCGITKAKNLYCFGYNGNGQVGDGTTDSPRLSLHRVGAAGVWARVSAGGNHTCAITQAENLYCWGNNDSGQVGDGTDTTPRLSLFRVGAAGVWARVSAGGNHTCAITQAENLYCWGNNGSGQTGDGTINPAPLDLHRVGAAGVWSGVIAGLRHTCGITKAKNLYCWGENGFGQTGDGTIDTPRLSLHRVGAAGVWSSANAGNAHTCGVTQAKNLYCWGYNLYGQVGDGTIDTPRLSLFRVGAAGVWSSVEAGSFHTCGITQAKNLYCWGNNTFGEVGDNTANTPHPSLFRVV